MDDFSVYGTSVDKCVHNLDKFCRDVRKLILFSIGRNAILWLMKALFSGIKFLKEVLKLIELKWRQLRKNALSPRCERYS